MLSAEGNDRRALCSTKVIRNAFQLVTVELQALMTKGKWGEAYLYAPYTKGNDCAGSKTRMKATSANAVVGTLPLPSNTHP